MKVFGFSLEPQSIVSSAAKYIPPPPTFCPVTDKVQVHTVYEAGGYMIAAQLASIFLDMLGLYRPVGGLTNEVNFAADGEWFFISSFNPK